MLACSVFSLEPKASNRSRTDCRSFASSSHCRRTCSGTVTCRASSSMAARHVTAREQNGGRDAWLDQREADADGDDSSRVADRAADLRQRQKGVQGGPPFRDRPFDQGQNEGVDDLVADRLAGLQRAAQVGAGLLGGGPTGPVTASGEFDGGRGETVRSGVPGPGPPVGGTSGQVRAGGGRAGSAAPPRWRMRTRVSTGCRGSRRG